MLHSTDPLKVILICSSAEPGRDGVGDYCRRLAAQLITQGGACAILSINDRCVSNVIITTQPADGVEVPVLRMPPGLSSKTEIAKAKSWINELNPDYLSLQYVTFGYHPKGLKLGLSKKLLSLSSGRAWHIMFHELWVGMAVEESAKLHIWGKLQKQLIRSLIVNLQPKLIHTQTRLYQSLLGRMGFTASYLPLFSNIPLCDQPQQLTGDITFIVFGTIHSGAAIAAFAKEVALYSAKIDKPITLNFLGRCGAEQDRWVFTWQANGLPVKISGELPAEEISLAISRATLALSATALAVIDKSGSFAAMREHGVPVVSISKPWRPLSVPQPDVPPGIITYRPGNFEECMAFKPIYVAGNGVTQVSAKFAKDLNALKNMLA